ncbi:hypothetical protein SHIRM173S_04872 [Streptomyces hirsutus]
MRMLASLTSLQPCPRPVLLGEVMGRHADTDDPAGVVGERCDTGQPGVLVALSADPQTRLHVVAPARPQHLAHVLLQLPGPVPAADVAGLHTAQMGGRQPEELRHRVVGTAQAQVLAEDDGGARGLEHGRPEQRIADRIGVAGPQRGDGQPVVGLTVLRPAAVGEQPYGDGAAVPVPERERAAPTPVARRPGRLRPVGEQAGRRAADPRPRPGGPAAAGRPCSTG